MIYIHVINTTASATFLRKFVVDKCGITPIRLSNVEVVASARDHVDVHIQLLDVPPLKGNVESRSSVSLEDAVWRLGLAIDKQKDIGITVTYPEGTTRVVVIPGSLRTDDMSTRSYETGHTGGTLAAIGVAMLFVGMILAPAAAYVIWKKNISIPYFIQ
ncbi:hypothetical protein LSAT2_027903 [Lamellibrachia satsuma]|nr:hypothetical protein LSAT2_027903 [Lamellibrachia satsuma]